MKKSKGRCFILFIFLALIVCYNLNGVLGADASASLNFKGEWDSKDFSSISDWKSFVNVFTATIFKFRVAEKNETIQFGLTDSGGGEHFFDTPVKYNDTNGELSILYNVTLPNGEVRYLDYKATLNGNSDIRKVVSPKQYFGSTIGDIVKDVLSKKVEIGLVGARSNITMTANKNFSLDNPIIDINYQRNIEENFTSPITEEVEEEIIVNNSNTSIVISNTTQLKNITNESIENSSNEEVIIENPDPYLEKVSMFINETKVFSIENPKEDSIKWYLNGKLVKKDIISYSFKGLKKGNYNISVEVKEGLENQKYAWNVEVKVRETPKKSSSFLIWIIAGFFILLFGGIIYYLKRQGQSKDLQPSSSIQSN